MQLVSFIQNFSSDSTNTYVLATVKFTLSYTVYGNTAAGGTAIVLVVQLVLVKLLVRTSGTAAVLMIRTKNCLNIYFLQAQ